MKVFCIGAHKTGTSSMESALTLLGLRVCPTQLWWENPAIQTAFYCGEYSPVFDLIERYDAFQDSPFNHSAFYEVLCERYPSARFILTVRDTDGWIASRKRWRAILIAKLLTHDAQLREAGRLFLLHEYGQADYLNVDEPSERAVFESRNQAVITFFKNTGRPLLVLDLETEMDPWQRLCGWLGLAVPGGKFPHANRTQ